MPPKRPAESEAATQELKKFRSAIDAVADDWVCPITCELPIDPVVAEDGRVYERAAIQEHIDKKGAGLKSPMTNEAMGPRLFPSAQARSTIEKLVRSGAISGDKAELWRKRIEEEEDLKKLREQAEGGDTKAMYDLGVHYAFGCKPRAWPRIAPSPSGGTNEPQTPTTPSAWRMLAPTSL